MLYDFEVFPLELERCSSENHRSFDHLPRSYPSIHLSNDPAASYERLFRNSISFIIQRIARLTFHFLPPRSIGNRFEKRLLAKFQFVERIIIHEYRMQALIERLKAVTETAYGAKAIFVSYRMQMECRRVHYGRIPGSFVCDGLSFVRSEPITRLDFPRQ